MDKTYILENNLRVCLEVSKCIKLIITNFCSPLYLLERICTIEDGHAMRIMLNVSVQAVVRGGRKMCIAITFYYSVMMRVEQELRVKTPLHLIKGDAK